MLLSSLCAAAVSISLANAIYYVPPESDVIHGVSTEDAGIVSVDEYGNAQNSGYTVTTIRGYGMHYESPNGGQVVKNFRKTYDNAVQAGYTQIDTFMFPCTGSTHDCKSPQDQANDFVSYLQNNNYTYIARIWLNIQNDVSSNAHNWDYGHDGNKNKAQEVLGALQDAAGGSYTVGIQSSPGQWQEIFGSYDWSLDPSAPLFYVYWDGRDSAYDLESLRVPIGMWSSASARQYANTAQGLTRKFRPYVLLP